MEDLEPFYPDRMAGRILGMGDVLSFVEKAQEVVSTNYQSVKLYIFTYMYINNLYIQLKLFNVTFDKLSRCAKKMLKNCRRR